MLDTMATDSSDSDSEVEPPLSVRLYATKPRNLVQRRATITGASPTTKHGIDIEQFWRELKQEHSTTFQLRDKAASCAHGLDSVPSNLRPQTCLGIEQTKRKKRPDDRHDDRRVQFNENRDNRHSHLDEFVTTKDSTTNRREIVSITSNDNHSDNTVPFDKCDETSSISSVHDKDSTRSNEIGSRCRKERGKLDKSHSTPAYDLTEPTFTDITEIREPRTKINNVGYNCATSAPSIIVNETDSRVSNDNLDNNDMPRDPEIKSVAQRVNFIESHINHKDCEDSKKINDEQEKNNISRSTNNDIRLKGGANDILSNNDVTVTTELTRSAIEKLEIEPVKNVSKISLEYSELGRESSEEKSESISSYMDGTYSSSSDADVPLKKLLENEAIIAHGFAERNVDSNSIKNVSKTRRSQDDNLSREGKYASFEPVSPKVTTPVRMVGESTRVELPKKSETKLRQTPPEPPPRKYFSKPLPLNLSGVSSIPDIREQPKVPERNDIRIEQKKIDFILETPAIAESSTSFQNREAIEGYRDFVEKSTDFIDEPLTQGHKSESIIDPYGYTEIYDGQLKDERIGNSIYSASGHSQPELVPRSHDSTDGSGCSRQACTPNLKTKTLEKDKYCEKGVVNRAMMVARSMGLHSGSNKSSNGSSPRSNRKRNILLASKFFFISINFFFHFS